ncbi:Poly [ADP-ribose] polymerase 1 [Gonapodya sp. JEL0774]|nr:Poly [ADP-ribose] polymerase 1 [Gonapodya sp. JEL0774]
MIAGKLSKAAISRAYTILAEAQELVNQRTHNSETPGLKSGFAHDEDLIQSKLSMLDTLRDIEVFNSIIAEETDEKKAENVVDQHYKKLKCSIEVVDNDSVEFSRIKKQLDSTHAPTHSQYSLEIEHVFRVSRDQDEERLSNWVGILSQGLRIAPPEAPVTGYMFGKALYFADMVSKSANYCFATPTNPYGLLTLCEVALGDMYELTAAQMITKLPPGKESTKGCGKTGPSSFDLEDGLRRPLGPPTGQNIPGTKRTDLLYNEYMVYSESQQRMRYLVKVKFHFGRSGRF